MLKTVKKCKKYLKFHVKGKVTGNLNGKNIELLAGNVFGNISAQKDIHLDHQSLVIGNISAENVEAGGRIKGDLKIKSKTRLVSGVMLVGNVKTDAISLEEGARISGSIEMNCEGEGGFPHGAGGWAARGYYSWPYPAGGATCGERAGNAAPAGSN